MLERFGIGNIISLVLALCLAALCVWFFIKKRSPKLTVFYLTVVLCTAGLHILSWFYSGMGLAVALLNAFLTVVLAAAVIVYQNDFKVLFSRMTFSNKKSDSITFSDEELQKSIEEIVKSAQSLSKTRTGALMVIVPKQISQHIIDSGVALNSLVKAPLLESIFITRAPMHDGAVIIKGNKLLAAGCFLPLSQTQNLPKDLGTRHRAAIGITEETDNISIVVSEETGIISVSVRGVLRRYITPERLSDILHGAFGVTVSTTQGGPRRFF